MVESEEVKVSPSNEGNIPLNKRDTLEGPFLILIIVMTLAVVYLIPIPSYNVALKNSLSIRDKDEWTFANAFFGRVQSQVSYLLSYLILHLLGN